jgi:hypothetical protein
MNGAMFNSASRTALIAAAGLLLGGVAMPSAKAADLGGNCCADLEERVAELEATTVRKGNRKMSVTITGQVHKMILWWDDGLSSKTYYGLDNRNSSTRFSILGEAKVTPAVKMGFEIMIDNNTPSSASVSQIDPNGKAVSITTGSPLSNYGATSFSGVSNDGLFAGARRMIFWIEDAKLGRVSVGHYEMAGAITTIDLGGISAGASASLRLVNGSFYLRGPAGQFYPIQWVNILDFSANQPRMDEVRWDSPTIQGFILSSSVANDGSNWGVMLRYANEFSGYRVAAGIGYEHYGQQSASNACAGGVPGTGAPCVGPVDLTLVAPDVDAWGVGASALHVPSGLFVQGHYIHVDFDQINDFNFNGSGSFSWWGQTGPNRIPADQWLIQGGVTKNWFGWGNTALFGEYSINRGWGASQGAFTQAGCFNCGRNFGVVNFPGGTAVNGVTDTEVTMYGFGITQNVDAAATELYLDWRHFSADVTCSSTGVNCSGTGATVGSVAMQKLQTEDFWAVIGGARVKF